MPFTFSVKDSYRAAVEAATGGKNTVVYDDKGNPSIMVFVPKVYLDDLITGAPHDLHPAFKVNGVEIKELWVSKYQNIVVDSRAYSLPMQDPKSYINFDGALQACFAKGSGFHLMSNAEWAAIALLSKKKGTMPRGNNYAGGDISALYESGKETYDWVQSSNWNNRARRFDGTNYHHTGRVASGSGPASWTHDGTPEGIYDLNGNVWEWVSGMRLKNGEIQVIKDNDASLLNADHSDTSPLWQAMLQDGSLVLPGTASTLKFDNTTAGSATQDGNDVGGDPILNTSIVNKMYTGGDVNDYWRYSTCNFESLAAQSGVTVPTLLKALGIAPIDAQHGGDGLWVRNYGERLPFRGGYWSYGASAGVFALNLSTARSDSGDILGFRSAYCVL